jgi:hypothetical protein
MMKSPEVSYFFCGLMFTEFELQWGQKFSN